MSVDNDFVLCPAPAKINLFLHVTGRRPDGYHLLQTAFRMLDHGDTLGFRVRDDGAIVRTTDLPGVPAEADLTVKAAKLLQARTGCRQGADIQIDKRLPMGGGLGGGSSDAATALLALNHLWNTGVDRTTLQQWALELGADVPFFIFGRTALGEGVGEALRPLELPSTWYVVIEPPASVPTVEIFTAKELTRDTKPLIIAGFAVTENLRCLQQGRNDLEPVASSRYPVVAQALEALAEFGKPRMSGSGACVFLDCEQQATAEMVVERLKANWRIWCAPSLDRHPLLAWARD
jgi:4-diphosphocytidyl-2-C-methyl-D-erythritol kinase